MQKAGRLAGAAAFAVICGRVHAAEAPVSPTNFLVEAARAASISNFEGTAVYQGGNGVEVLRVIHRFARGHETEHVITLNGPPRELLQEDDRVTCIMPRDERLSFGRPAIKGLLHGLTPERLNDLAPYYQIEDLGTDRIAGRVCRGVAFKPSDKYRYGYRLWAEVDSHVPLKVELVSADGSMLEQLMFTQVLMPRVIPNAAFVLRLADHDRYKVVTRSLEPTEPVNADVGSGQSVVHWRLGALPPGFHVTMHAVHRMPHESDLVDHTLLSDGLSAVSIFSSHQAASENAFKGLSRRGAVNAYGRMIGDEHVTVVGEAPADAVRMIGDGLQAVAPGAVPVSQGAVPVSRGAVPVAR